MSSELPAPHDQILHTPLTGRHIELGAKMVPFAGYLMPIQYEGIVAEHKAVRNQAGLFDVCHMGEIRITGSGATDFVNLMVTNDLEKIDFGQAMYTCACFESGGIVDDLIVYKHSAQNVLIVCNASNREKFWQHISQHARSVPGIELTDESDRTGLIALQGPVALKILELAAPELGNLADNLGTFRFLVAKLCGAEVTIARTGYTGEDGVEIFCPADSALAIWNHFLEVGAPLGLAPAGLGCRDTLRLEGRLSLYGHELDESTSPLEAGLGWVVKLDKTAFLGRDALLGAQAAGLARKLVGFEVTSRGSARAGYPLLDQAGTAVGICTSGGPSPTLGIPLGLGYLPTAMSKIGTEFFVDARGKRLTARVVKTPFYRRA